jgi:hypothetical protein
MDPEDPIDPVVWRALLVAVRARHWIDTEWHHLEPEFGPITRQLVCNLRYLDEHGLIRMAVVKGSASESVAYPTDLWITAAGIDYLKPDGGYTAEREVVRVQLETDTLRALLELRIAQSSLPEAKKRELKDSIRALPGVAMKTAVEELVKAMMADGPGFIAFLQRWVSAAAAYLPK